MARFLTRYDPVLLGYAPIPPVVGLAVVAVMVYKPDWTGCLDVLCAGVLVGLAAGQVVVRRTPAARSQA